MEHVNFSHCVSSDFSKLNDLYLKVLAVKNNVGSLIYEKDRAEAEASRLDPEVRSFFRLLDSNILIMIDRIRETKFEVFDSLPMVSDILKDEKLRETLSEILFEFVFSGLAICFLDSILKKSTGARGKYSITSDYLWEIFSEKSLKFKVPEMHEFFTGPENRDISSMFKLMLDCMYDRIVEKVPSFSELEGQIADIVREVVERSMVEGMLLFRSYEQALDSLPGGHVS